ncbi:MAG: hypothetical protein ABJA87_14035, partial [bacterium]
MFYVVAISGIFIGGVDHVSGSFLSAAWWASVGLLVGGLLVCLVVLLKGKIVTGVLGVVALPIAVVGAVRLASRSPGGRSGSTPSAHADWLAPRSASIRPMSNGGTGSATSSPGRPHWHQLSRLDPLWARWIWTSVRR